MSSPSAPLCVAQRPLSFMFVGPNTEFYIPNRKQFSIDFKNKVNNNIWGQIPMFRVLVLGGVILKFRSHQCNWGSTKVMKIVATYSSAGGRRETQGCFFQERKMHGSRHEHLFEENVRKNQKKGVYEF